MRTGLSSVAASLVLAIALGPRVAAAQNTTQCLYNDEHFHIQDFKADGPRLPEILKMMDDRVCRTTLMGLAITVAHDPLIDRDFAPLLHPDRWASALLQRHSGRAGSTQIPGTPGTGSCAS